MMKIFAVVFASLTVAPCSYQRWKPQFRALRPAPAQPQKPEPKQPECEAQEPAPNVPKDPWRFDAPEYGFSLTVPSSEWKAERGVVVNELLPPAVARFLNSRTGADIGVWVYPSSSAGPVMMAYRTRFFMAMDLGAQTSMVDQSDPLDRSASFTFALVNGKNKYHGKVIVLRFAVKPQLSLIFHGRWQPKFGRESEKDLESLAGAIADIQRGR